MVETEDQQEISIDQVLDKLNLADYKETFAKEKVDLETLVSAWRHSISLITIVVIVHSVGVFFAL